MVCNSSITSSVTVCDVKTGSLTFNGDDAVELNCTGATLDVIGQIGNDPGSAWGSEPITTLDDTLRRKCTINTGDTTGSDAFDPATEWDGYAIDTFDDLGSHCAASSSVTPDAAGQLVITEMMNWNNGDGDWFEIYNPSSSVVYDLDGCEVATYYGTPHTISGTLEIAPGGYLTIGSDAITGFSPDYSISGFDLDEGDDYLVLTCATGIDDVLYESYPTSTFPLLEGSSLNLSPASFDAVANDTASNWCLTLGEYTTANRGTPGAANETCTTGTVGWCNVQWPEYIESACAEGTCTAAAPTDVYGRLWIDGVTGTTGSGLTNQVVVQMGYADTDWVDYDPRVDDVYEWLPAVHNPSFVDSNNSEYVATMPLLPTAAYAYTFRMSYDGGVSWLHCEVGSGTSDNSVFDIDNAGVYFQD